MDEIEELKKRMDSLEYDIKNQKEAILMHLSMHEEENKKIREIIEWIKRSVAMLGKKS